MNRSRGLSWVVAASLLVVAACGERPTGPEDAGLAPVAAFGRPTGEKPGKPSSDIPLTVVFTDEGNRIRSDLEAPLSEFASDTYVDGGDDFVSAKIKSSGQFYFQAFSGKETGKKRDPVLRGITVDLTDQRQVMSEPDLEDFMDAVGDDYPVFTSDVTLHTRDNDGGLSAMNVGDFFADGGKIAFNDYGDGDAWEWRLLFDTRVDTDGDGVTDRPDGFGLCVHQEAPDRWTVVAEDGACGGDVDGITELWRVQGGVFTPVAKFHTPMHLTLRERNP